MGLLVEQVKSLVKKDFWIIRAHKKAVCAEILVPVLMAGLTAMMLHFLNTVFVEGAAVVSAMPQPNYQANLFIAPPTLLQSMQGWNVFRNDSMEAGLQQYQLCQQRGEFEIGVGNVGLFAPGYTENRTAFLASDPLTVLYNEIPASTMLSFATSVFGLYNPLAADAASYASQHGSNSDSLLSSASTSAAFAANITALQAYAMPASILFGNSFNLGQMVASVTVMFTAFAFFPLLNNSAGRLTDEKRCKMREHLRVMGVRPAAYVLSVYGSGALRVLFVAVAVLIAIFAAQGLDGATTVVFLLLLVLFGFSLISFSQLMPAFFSRSAFATGTCTLFLVGGVVGGVFSTQLPAGAQFALAFLFSPVAYAYAAGILVGGFTITLPVPFSVSLLFLLMQIVWYALLSQYLCAVFPGDYGVPQSPLFPFYMLRRSLRGGKVASGLHSLKEIPSEDRQDAIVLRDLVKCYGSQRETRAVDSLSLSVRQGEIFVLLGHNGAGKTTTISMLTGMLDSTSYAEASVAGLDLARDIDLIRNRIGSCPQFDILFDDLSGMQHMEIFSRIKGVPPAAGEDLLRLLGLPLDGQKSRTYSGGMKRRLSVACALVGGSNIIFLDEPSSGLDPLSRRQLWDLLRSLRSQGRTVVLTTHFMEEADYLGDRIAIMSHGRLYCCDTSSALKHEYGVGYYLTLVKPTSADARQERPVAAVDAQTVLARIREHCPDATLHHESMGDVQFVLPVSRLSTFGSVLGMVEQSLGELGATSYGVRMNSLEDVFLSISQKESQSRLNGEDPLDTSGVNTKTLADGTSAEEEFAAAAEVGMVRLFLSQLLTVLLKKWWNLKRSKRMWFLGIFMPMVLTAVGFATVIELPSQSDQLASGTRYVDVFDWVVPTIGHLTPLQVEYLAVASSLYPKYVNTLNPLVPNSDSTGPNFVPDVRLSFRLISRSQAATGSFIDTRSLAFTQMSDDEHPVQIAFTNEMYDATFDSEELSPQEHYEGLSVAFYASRRYSPACSFFLHQLLHFSRVELLRRYNPTIPAPVWPNYTMAPLPPVDGSQQESSSDSSMGIQSQVLVIPLGVFIVLAVAEYAANAALEVADELNRHIFHTLRMHGLSVFAYWTGTLLFDSLVSVLIIGVFVGGVYVRDLTFLQNDFLVWVSFQILGLVVHLLLLAYALMTLLPTVKPSTYIAAVLGCVTASLVIPVIIFVIVITTGGSTQTLDVVNGVFMWPARAVEFSFQAADPQAFFSTRSGRVAFASVWFWSAVPLAVLFWYSSKSTRGRRRVDYSTGEASAFIVNAATPLMNTTLRSTVDDPDVAAEAQRVLADPSANMAATIHLRQDYGGKKLAVKDMTFGVRRGECFGLLGPNGAGKTTTVKMMLQELCPSSGAATFPYSPATLDNSFLLDSVYRKLRLGVCQQHDTLWESFTDREHMELYLRIRLGPRYSSRQWSGYCDAAIRKVFLESDGKRAEAYSGGMKRKLSVCVALYTGSRSVFLDEPSTGMDPFARRAMWKSINEALEADRCVLLTTHSMEEADSVCSRIAIVTDGTMQCIGSGQHLKNRFGKGYAITLILAEDSDENIERKAAALDASMAAAFGEKCARTERIGTTVHYSVPELSVARAFDVLASRQAEWSLTGYNVNQVTSLEQIFVAFAGRSAVEP